MQEKATSVYEVAGYWLLGVNLFRGTFGVFGVLMFELRDAPNVNNKTDWANDAGEQEHTPAHPNHSDAKASFWDCDRERSADEPSAKDDGADFVCESGADALLVVFAVDEIPDNDQDIS